MTKFEDNLSPYLTIVEATEPSAPSAGQQRVYIDSTTHLLKATNSSGTDRTIEGVPAGAITSSGLTQATARLLGRTTASTGAVEEISVGSGLSLAAGALTATGGSAGALVFLEAHTASASATLDFTSFISSTYDTYMFKFVTIVPATSTAILNMRMGTGGGPTYDTGGNYGTQLFRHSFNASALSGADSGATSIALTTAWLSAGNHPIAGSLELYDPQNTSWFKWVSGKFVYPDSGISNMAVSEMGGEYLVATAVTAVRFYMSSGNITSGTIRVYGVAKS